MIDVKDRPNNLSVENLHTPKVVDMPSRDYFYDNEAMLKMPIANDQFSVGSVSNATHQIQIWEKQANADRKMAKTGQLQAPPKYPWENRESSLNQITKLK